jgi:hypothetical protein
LDWASPKQGEKCSFAATLARNDEKRFFDYQKGSADRFTMFLAQGSHGVGGN